MRSPRDRPFKYPTCGYHYGYVCEAQTVEPGLYTVLSCVEIVSPIHFERRKNDTRYKFVLGSCRMSYPGQGRSPYVVVSPDSKGAFAKRTSVFRRRALKHSVAVIANPLCELAYHSPSASKSSGFDMLSSHCIPYALARCKLNYDLMMYYHCF